MADVEKFSPNNGHLSEEQLTWHYYGEDGDSAEVDLHLTLCATCRGEYESLKLAMKTIEAWPVPARGAEYGEDVWRALLRRDASIGSRRPWWKRWLAPQKLAVAAALATLLVAAFLGGKAIQKQEQIEVVASSQVVRERILAVALSDHLEQSQRILMEITNSEEKANLNVADEQRRAESLLNANRLYRQTAARQGHAALVSVLEDLERVLLDVAHGPQELSPAELKHLRARMDDEGLLFKVRILELRLRELENQPLSLEPAAAMKG